MDPTIVRMAIEDLIAALRKGDVARARWSWNCRVPNRDQSALRSIFSIILATGVRSRPATPYRNTVRLRSKFYAPRHAVEEQVVDALGVNETLTPDLMKAARSCSEDTHGRDQHRAPDFSTGSPAAQATAVRVSTALRAQPENVMVSRVKPMFTVGDQFKPLREKRPIVEPIPGIAERRGDRELGLAGLQELGDHPAPFRAAV